MSQSYQDSNNPVKTDIKIGGNVTPMTSGVGGDGVSGVNSNFAYNVGGPETLQKALELVQAIAHENLAASESLVKNTLASGDSSAKAVLENNESVISSLNQLLTKERSSSSEELLKKYGQYGLAALALIALALWATRR